MRNRKIVVSIVSFLALALFATGCPTYPETRDFLEASGTVLGADAQSPVTDLPISAYRWIISYKDGSTVAEEFDLTGYKTDASGKFGFLSAELALQSGNLAESCTDVCVGWATDYEDVCVDWETEYYDVCEYWDVDADGIEYCASWTVETYEYCAAWETQAYDYCVAWAEDCDYYYPARSITDITSGWSEIDYRLNSTLMTTQSESVTRPGDAVSSTRTGSGDDEVIDYKWTQDDVFITPLATSLAKSSATLSATRQALTLERNKGKVKKGPKLRFGRTHKAATVIPHSKLSTLSAKQRAMVDAARKVSGAYLKR